MRTPWRRIVISAIGLCILVVATSAVTASNTVPASNLGEDLRGIGVNDVKPAECGGITLTTIVTAGTGANDLVLGTGGADNLRGRQGADCIVAGAGNDNVRGDQSGDVLLGGNGDDDLRGNQGTDACYGNAGTDTFNSCETQVQ